MVETVLFAYRTGPGRDVKTVATDRFLRASNDWRAGIPFLVRFEGFALAPTHFTCRQCYFCFQLSRHVVDVAQTLKCDSKVGCIGVDVVIESVGDPDEPRWLSTNLLFVHLEQARVPEAGGELNEGGHDETEIFYSGAFIKEVSCLKTSKHGQEEAADELGAFGCLYTIVDPDEDTVNRCDLCKQSND